MTVLQARAFAEAAKMWLNEHAALSHNAAKGGSLASPAKTGEPNIFSIVAIFAPLRETSSISRKGAKAAKGLASPPRCD
jgi:hypothetical protein